MAPRKSSVKSELLYSVPDILLSPAYKLLSTLKDDIYPDGFPSYIDVDTVFDHLMRSPDMIDKDKSNHVLVRDFNKLNPDFSTWRGYKNNWAECEKIPNYGDVDKFFALFALYKGNVTSMEWSSADMGWILLKPGTPRHVPPFWAGSNWTSKSWVAKNMGTPTKYTARDPSLIQLHLGEIFRCNTADKFISDATNAGAENETTSSDYEDEATGSDNEDEATGSGSEDEATGSGNEDEAVEPDIENGEINTGNLNFQEDFLSDIELTLDPWPSFEPSSASKKPASAGKKPASAGKKPASVPMRKRPSMPAPMSTPTKRRRYKLPDGDESDEYDIFAIDESLATLTPEERFRRIELQQREMYKDLQACKRTILKQPEFKRRFDERRREMDEEETVVIGRRYLREIKSKKRN